MNQIIICLAIGIFPVFIANDVEGNEYLQVKQSNQERANEDAEYQKFVLVVKLGSENIKQLRQTGTLKTKIPKKLQNHVGSIRFQGPTSFLSEPVVVETMVDKRDRSLMVTLDNSILDRLDYQPIELKIYDSGFDGLLLVYSAKGSVAGKLPETPIARDANDSPIVFVRINSNRGIHGTIKELKNLAIKTEFGDVTVPMAQIAGIRVDDTNKKQVLVVLKQGDAISGVIAQEKIIVKSRWGEKEIGLGEIESITWNRDSRFEADSDSPGRWRLKSVSSIAQKQPDSKTQLPQQFK